MKIPLSKPYLDEREAQAAARVVRSGWLSQGEEVAKLEEEFGKYLDPEDPPYVIATSSCTTALELVLRVAGASPSVPVICPSYTFVASANAAKYCRAPVELCDIDLETYNIDPYKLPLSVDLHEPHIIMAVHQVGLPCDVDGIRKASPRAIIVEDGACAIGARYPDWKRVGARYDTFATCFSLHGSKSIVAGEGGLISTRNKEIADRVRRLRQHGVNIAAEVRKGAEREAYLELGYNYRMTDIQAAIARIQIEKADEIIAGRRIAAAWYNDRLERTCRIPRSKDGSLHAYQRYLIRISGPELAATEDRERIVEALTREGISCRRGLQVLHKQPYWHGPIGDLTMTELAAATTIQLPLWPTMSLPEVEHVCDVIRETLRT